MKNICKNYLWLSVETYTSEHHLKLTGKTLVSAGMSLTSEGIWNTTNKITWNIISYAYLTMTITYDPGT